MKYILQISPRISIKQYCNYNKLIFINQYIYRNCWYALGIGDKSSKSLFVGWNYGEAAPQIILESWWFVDPHRVIFILRMTENEIESHKLVTEILGFSTDIWDRFCWWWFQFEDNGSSSSVTFRCKITRPGDEHVLRHGNGELQSERQWLGFNRQFFLGSSAICAVGMSLVAVKFLKVH